MENWALFQGSRVLVTGHTGFKGSWLTWLLRRAGAHVRGISLEPPSSPSLYELTGLRAEVDDLRLDITDIDALKPAIHDFQPDFVFHLAAQSLVRESYLDPIRTYRTNVLGTLNVLEALRATSTPVVAILITSDKAYENVEWVWSYRESDRLGGRDPYSASKGATELLISSHVRSFFPHTGPIRVGVGRAGNVIGGGDWSTDRVVPDCVRAWTSGQVAMIRNPSATRPWQHVLEPLSGYLSLALELSGSPRLHGEAFNFGPSATKPRPVEDMVDGLARHWPGAMWDTKADLSPTHEATLLQLNCEKAAHDLGWFSTLRFDEMLAFTADWYYQVVIEKRDARSVTISQIEEFSRIADSRRVSP